MSKLQEDLKVYSEEVQDVLSDPPKAIIKWGNTILFLFFILVLLLSWFIKYPDIISAQATITTKVSPQKVFARSTGKISKLMVSNNENVNQNKTLAIIENTATYEDVRLLQKIIDTVVINNKTINFPIEEIPILFLGEIDNDFALFENNYIQYKLNEDLQPYSSQSKANKFSISELKRRLENMKSQIALNKAELSFIKKDLDRNETLFKKGVISAMEFENKQLEHLQAERNLTTMSASLSQLREAISNAKNTSENTEITETRENVTLRKSVIQSYNQLKKSIKDWEMQYILTSDMNGIISFMNPWRKNQTVNTGDFLFTIVPANNASFIARLKTPAQNSGKLKLGQNVNIKLANFPSNEFGILRGKVKNISLVPDVDGLYNVDVNLPSKLITSYDIEIDFRQEMSGTAEVITEDLRLIERFFYQFRDILQR